MTILQNQAIRTRACFQTTPLKSYGVYTSQITPLNPPLERGETRKSSSLPFARAEENRNKQEHQGKQENLVPSPLQEAGENRNKQEHQGKQENLVPSPLQGEG
ncbi:hypothetical protein A4S05_08085 [Nostoc sp. KVJ20]|nr:hypothetical protein A4S05_08085 [Nostoc sp. KVJ20]